MKHMRKLVTLVVVLAMVMAFMVPTAMAATIEVKNVLDGETYTAYKILNYTNSGDAYSYYLTADEYTSIGSTLEAAGFAFTASADGTQYFVNNAGTIDVAAAAASLANATLGDALGKYTATGANNFAVFGELPTGYYFVTTSTGSLCALHSETAITGAVEKNTVPFVDKKQGTTENNYVYNNLHLNMGDTVYYQITVTDGIGTNKAITLTDTLSDGLTYTAGTIKINATTVADDANDENYKVTVADQVITIELKDTYVAALDKDATVVITYAAKVNENATVNSITANSNTVKMNYSAQESTKAINVATYDINLKKVDVNDNVLTGAKFKVYTAADGTTPLKFSQDATGYYYDANGSYEEIEAGSVNIRGLAPATYWFEETVAPSGYNKLSERKEVTVAANATAAVEFEVENQAGTVLPSTGGMGTTIFYILGGLMVVGAAVVLVTNKRMRGQM